MNRHRSEATQKSLQILKTDVIRLTIVCGFTLVGSRNTLHSLVAGDCPIRHMMCTVYSRVAPPLSRGFQFVSCPKSRWATLYLRYSGVRNQLCIVDSAEVTQSFGIIRKKNIVLACCPMFRTLAV